MTPTRGSDRSGNYNWEFRENDLCFDGEKELKKRKERR
jgi:hypothetical protein